MSKLMGTDRHMSRLTQVPGCAVYMPPEALMDKPVYTNKLDSFSYGVLAIQILTCKFPAPGPPRRRISDPKYGPIPIEVPIPEPERRKSHIGLVDPAHPILKVALACLSYEEKDRPSSGELCSQVGEMKESGQYAEGVRQEAEGRAKVELQGQRDLELSQLREQLQRLEEEKKMLKECVEELTPKKENAKTEQRANGRENVITKKSNGGITYSEKRGLPISLEERSPYPSMDHGHNRQKDNAKERPLHVPPAHISGAVDPNKQEVNPLLRGLSATNNAQSISSSVQSKGQMQGSSPGVPTSQKVLHPGVQTSQEFLYPGVQTSQEFLYPGLQTSQEFLYPGLQTSQEFLYPGLQTSQEDLYPGLQMSQEFLPVVQPGQRAGAKFTPMVWTMEGSSPYVPTSQEFLRVLKSSGPQRQKQLIGEELYRLIYSLDNDLAGELTETLLKMDNSKLLHMLEDPESLKYMLKELVCVSRHVK